MMVKYANYQVYISHEFSSRFNMDKHGGLVINPVLREDAAIYECRSFMLLDEIASLVYGSSVNLKLQGNYFYKIRVIA